jgi:NitT/TauT family transport system substrate-binding protein
VKILKVSRFLILAVVVASLFISCSPAAPAAQFSIRFGAFAAQDMLSYFVMADQGFAQKNGIQFTETAFLGGAAAIDAVLAGSLDACFAGTVPVIAAAQQGLIPGKIVPAAAVSFSDPEHPNIGVLANTSIKTWRELAGQNLGVNALNGIPAAALKGRLKLEGVSDYKLVEIPLANLGLAISGGNVVAASIPEPYLTQSLLRGDGKLLDWVIGGQPFPQMQNADMVFSAALYQGNPAAVKSLLRAFLETAKWINQNPDAARTILIKRLSLTPEVAQKMKLIRCPADGRNDPVLLDSMQTVLMDIGMLKAPIPARQLYDETLLNEVLSERR